MGRGYHISTRVHTPYNASHIAPDKEINRFLPADVGIDKVAYRVRMVHSDSRIKERYLVLTNNCLYIFNLPKLANSGYRPKRIDVGDISEILKPQIPETNFTVVLTHSRVMSSMYIQFIAPDREKFIEPLESKYQIRVRAIPLSLNKKIEKLD